MKINKQSAFPGKDQAVGKFRDRATSWLPVIALSVLSAHTVVGCLRKGYIYVRSVSINWCIDGLQSQRRIAAGCEWGAIRRRIERRPLL